jgi:hypothetical protein
MPYAIRLLFALLIGGYYYLPTKHSFADDQVVLLTEDGGVDGSLVGELNLGEVKGGSMVELSFAIKNPLDIPIVYNRVRPSCSCTSVTVIAETLAGGGVQSKPIQLSVKVPSIQGRNGAISDMVLLGDGSDTPVARILIKATIRRPFWVKDKSFSLSLDKSERFQTRFSFDTTTEFDPKLLTITVNDKDIKATLEQVDAKRSEIILVGSRQKALEARTIMVALDYQSTDWSIRDELAVYFYDQEAIKVFPPSVRIEKRSIEFKLYRKDGFSKTEPVVKSHDGLELRAESNVIGKSLLSVRVALPESIEPTKLVVEFGEVYLSIPVIKEEE